MTVESSQELEKANIVELRRRMKDLMPLSLYEDDNVFERFLRARNQNLDLAETMLKNHVRWRQCHKVDTIVQDIKPAEVLVKYNVMNRIGFDKEGAPVLYVAFGNLDCKGFYKSGTVNDFFYFFLSNLEGHIAAMKENSKKIGKPVNQWIMIFDYENFQLGNATHKPTLEFIFSMMGMYEANYPERLKSAYLINGSFVFQVCFAMCKPFLTGNTIQKVKILGKDFQDEMLKIMDADDLPAFLGGNRTDPDGNPKCVESIKFGGLIPERYYQTGKNRRLSIIPDSRLLIVNRLSRSKLEFEVVRPNSTIEWRYTIKNKNVDFAVLYKKHRGVPEAEIEEVLPKRRVETVIASEYGMCCCDKAGIYVLDFDNSYSWLHSKHIYYTVTVSNP